MSPQLAAILLGFFGIGECDVIEHNFVQRPSRPVHLSQYLFRDYESSLDCYFTLAWALERDCWRARNYHVPGVGLRAAFIGERSSGGWILIGATQMVGTITDYDPERMDFHEFGFESRWPKRGH